jgi:hypothetical protein
VCIDRSSFPRIASNINSLVLLGMPPPILRTRLVSSDRISFSYRSGRSQFLISKLILNNTRPTRTDQNEGVMCGSSSDGVLDQSVSIYTEKSKPEKREVDNSEEGPEAHVLSPIGHEVLSSAHYVRLSDRILPYLG